MNNKITYTDEPMELGERVEDFLPPPKALIPKTTKVQLTLTLNQETLEFFKAEAKRQEISYQEMISSLLDNYVQTK